MEYVGLHGKISEIAVKFPEKIAIKMGEQTITYRQLELKTNKVANFFYRRLEEHKNVPLMLENSVELIEGLLGVLKAGGIFAPIDPTFPENRIQFMIEKITAQWVITRREYLDKLNQIMAEARRTINVLLLDDGPITSEYANLKIDTLDAEVEEDPLFPNGISNKNCYIYFTSGSTGRPKAILGRHKSLEHFIEWEVKEFGVNEGFHTSQLTSPSFDPYLRDVFVPLTSGATMCIPPSREIVYNPLRLIDWINQEEITLMHIVPTLFKAIMEEVTDPQTFADLRYIISAGEMLRGHDVLKFFQLFKNRIQLVNFYGPTETTLVKLYYRVSEADVTRASIPIGKPIPGAQVMILNEDRQLAENGLVGEIYIRTPFISAGYYEDRELTREVFLQNPFSNNSQDIIYKTGDLGRILPSGDVEYLGRIDNQVKLRGFRVELGEIENVLLMIAGVKEAVVVAREDASGASYLSAYLQASGEVRGEQNVSTDEIVAVRTLDMTKIRAELQKLLPEYMVPSYFVEVEEMPHTPSGKIDRKALPEPQTLDTGEKYVAPRTEVEEKLLRIWAQVLQVENIGVQHNFFNLGGHSLKAMQIIGLVQKEFGVALTLQRFFVVPTVEGLAREISTMSADESLLIRPTEQKEYYHLSYPQRRLWFIHQLQPESIAYNMTGKITLYQSIDLAVLQKTLELIIERHESLRTAFLEINGEPMQKVLPTLPIEIEYYHIIGAIEVREEKFTEISRKPFDLRTLPLIRGALVKVAETEYDFIYSMHHIISDGSSMEILRKEFLSIYQALADKREITLPQLTIQYKDFAEWQNQIFEQKERFQVMHDFWVAQLSGLPQLNLPTDNPKEELMNRNTDAYRVVIGAECLNKLRVIAEKEETSLFIVLLTGFKLYLATLTNEQDIFVGLPVAGREQDALRNVIGFFVNTTLVRSRVELEKSFVENVKVIEGQTLQTLDYQNYPLETVTDELKISFPELPIFFNMLNMRENSGRELTDYEPHHLTGMQDVKFNQVYYLNEFPNGLEIICNYLNGLFTATTVEYMVKKYVSLLEMISEEPHQPVKELQKAGNQTKRRFKRS